MKLEVHNIWEAEVHWDVPRIDGNFGKLQSKKEEEKLFAQGVLLD